MTFGKNWGIPLKLMESRLKSGMSYTDVAAKIGVSRQAVSAWESSKSNPSFNNLLKWALTVGMDIFAQDKKEAIKTCHCTTDYIVISGANDPDNNEGS